MWSVSARVVTFSSLIFKQSFCLGNSERVALIFIFQWSVVAICQSGCLECFVKLEFGYWKKVFLFFGFWTNCAGSRRSSCSPDGWMAVSESVLPAKNCDRGASCRLSRRSTSSSSPHPHLAHTHLGPNQHRFQSYKYFMALCRQKTQRLDFMLHAKYLQELRVAGFVAMDDGGRLAVMEGNWWWC